MRTSHGNYRNDRDDRKALAQRFHTLRSTLTMAGYVLIIVGSGLIAIWLMGWMFHV